MKPMRVVVGLSGGVDSAVTAWLLKQQGHEVIGIFMKNWEDDDRPGGPSDEDSGKGGEHGEGRYCSSAIDFVDAAAVADVIGIEIEHVNFAADYKDRVFAEFLREYVAGRTPNPDVLCNAEIKFKAFLDHAMHLGADLIATGHYARVRQNGAQFELLKAMDHTKDQSYFLHRLNQAQLSKTLFPLGEIPKTEVRLIAEKLALPNAAKKDSTGICFIGERPFREFLNRYLSYKPGPMMTPDGKVVGEHVGLSFYTLGQRKGIGVGGMKAYKNPDGSSDAWYVAKKDVVNNILYIVQGHDHPWLLSAALSADQASWIAGHAPEARSMAAKTRYRQADVACAIAPAGDSEFALSFTEPQWAVTPGQSAVLYDGDVCLGGGIIAGSGPA